MPSLSEREARRLYRKTHWGLTGKGETRTLRVADPHSSGVAAELGRLVEVVYETRKEGDFSETEYVHGFRSPRPVLCHNGAGLLFIAGGGYRVEGRGIVETPADRSDEETSLRVANPRETDMAKRKRNDPDPKKKRKRNDPEPKRRRRGRRRRNPGTGMQLAVTAGAGIVGGGVGVGAAYGASRIPYGSPLVRGLVTAGVGLVGGVLIGLASPAFGAGLAAGMGAGGTVLAIGFGPAASALPAQEAALKKARAKLRGVDQAPGEGDREALAPAREVGWGDGLEPGERHRLVREVAAVIADDMRGVVRVGSIADLAAVVADDMRGVVRLTG